MTMTREARLRRAVEPSFFDPIPGIPVTPQSHRDDPSTSQRAAQKVTISARSRAYRVLGVYEGGSDWAADEAANALNETAYEVRKRVSDLIRLGLLEDAGTEGRSVYGNDARRLRITFEGHQALRIARGEK